MNYRLIHDRIIGRARTRDKPEEYCERHHVIPRSLGGDDSEGNVVWLTGREHYIVHWLLYRIHSNQQTAFAWHRMTVSRRNGGRRYTSHTFAYARRAQAVHMRAAKLGKTYAEIGRDPSTSIKGRRLTPEQRERVAMGSRGRKFSEDARRRLSAARSGAGNSQYGVTPSDEHRAKLSAALKAYWARKKELKACAT